MLKFLRKLIPETSFIRLFYHKIWALLGAIIYRFPGRKLKVIAVTGTNGKTTTVNLISQALTHMDKKVGMASTVNFQIGDKIWSNTMKQTTLGRFGLQKLLRQMVKEKCEYAVIEVSSHAVTQSRVLGISIDVVVLTNMGEDHCEYHGGFEKYREAKGKLFKKFHKYSVLNIDDKSFEYFNSVNRGKKLTYGFEDGDFHVSEFETSSSGSRFLLHTKEGMQEMNTDLSGVFNVYNLLASFAALSTFGFKISDIAEALSNAKGAPGRFEKIFCGQKFDVIVDFACDHIALENLLSLVKEFAPGRIISVFGAVGGGRDKHKRPKMGAVADKYADMIYLTTDDPYEEDASEIIDMILGGMTRQVGPSCCKILDRREAIHKALAEASDSDVVVISGKGGEEVIMLGNEKLPWSDREVVEEFFNL